jgi:aldose 1-epimerase
MEGYPGNLDITMTYSLTSKDELRVDYRATTDAPTPVNISHHPFFNLRGEGEGTVEDYAMCINADGFLPIDSLSIPLGYIAPVEGTPFDFRTPHPIGERIGEDDVQLRNARGYDHCWCLNKTAPGALESACTVYDPVSGRCVEVITDQIGLQFYSGNFFDGNTIGSNGSKQEFRSSFVLETQQFPDAPNQPAFPSILLLPGQTYTHTALYRFSAR